MKAVVEFLGKIPSPYSLQQNFNQILCQFFSEGLNISFNMPKSAEVDFASLCAKSIDTITEACKTCLVDYDRDKRTFVASTKKRFTHACVGLIRSDNSIEKDDLFVVPSNELTSQRITLDFANEENRVRPFLFQEMNKKKFNHNFIEFNPMKFNH